MNKLPSPKKIAFVLTTGILLLFLGSLLALFILHRWTATSNTECVAEIYLDGSLIQTIPLQTVKEAYSFTIQNNNSGFNTIQVTPGAIRVITASCPDKICVHQGWISDSLLPITCLPNRLVIRIRPSDKQVPDALTY